MSFLSLVRGPLGQQRDYKSPLPAGTEPDVIFTGAAMGGRVPAVGAQIQLAPDQLAVAPMNTSGAQKILGLGGRLAGASAVGGLSRVLGQAVDQQATTIPYDQITAVRPGTGPGVFSPPTLQIETQDGRTQQIGVTASLFSLNRSSANAQSRDALAQEIARRANLPYPN